MLTCHYNKAIMIKIMLQYIIQVNHFFQYVNGSKNACSLNRMTIIFGSFVLSKVEANIWHRSLQTLNDQFIIVIIIIILVVVVVGWLVGFIVYLPFLGHLTQN